MNWAQIEARTLRKHSRWLEWRIRTKPIRSKKWDSSFISCRNHLDRRCNRSRYIRDGCRLCGHCKVRRVDGSLRPGANKIRKRTSSTKNNEQRLWRQRSQRRRLRINEAKF